MSSELLKTFIRPDLNQNRHRYLLFIITKSTKVRDIFPIVRWMRKGSNNQNST